MLVPQKLFSYPETSVTHESTNDRGEDNAHFQDHLSLIPESKTTETNFCNRDSISTFVNEYATELIILVAVIYSHTCIVGTPNALLVMPSILSHQHQFDTRISKKPSLTDDVSSIWE